MSAVAKNLAAICAAIDTHRDSCEFPLIEVRLNPFEYERLGWEDVKGVAITEDPKLQTGRFRLVCANENGHRVKEREQTLTA